jgi:hypothetical protein
MAEVRLPQRQAHAREKLAPSEGFVEQRLTKVAGVRRELEAAKSRSGKPIVEADRACRGGKWAQLSSGAR